MTIPQYSPSTPISLGNLQSHFGGTDPIGIAEYFANTALVNKGSIGYPAGVLTQIPETGAISLSNFYGALEAVATYSIVANVTLANIGESIRFDVNTFGPNETVYYTIEPSAVFTSWNIVPTSNSITAGSGILEFTVNVPSDQFAAANVNSFYYHLVAPGTTTLFAGNAVASGNRSGIITVPTQSFVFRTGSNGSTVSTTSAEQLQGIITTGSSVTSSLVARSETINIAAPVIIANPVISNFSLTPASANEGNLITITANITDTLSRNVYFKLTGITANTADFVSNLTPNSVVTTAGTIEFTSTFNLAVDSEVELTETYNFDFHLDLGQPYFDRRGPFSILDTTVLTGTTVSAVTTSGWTTMTGSPTLPRSKVWVMFRMIGGGGSGGGADQNSRGGGSGGSGTFIRGIVRLPETANSKILYAQAGAGGRAASSALALNTPAVNYGVGGLGGVFGLGGEYAGIKDGSGGNGGGGIGPGSSGGFSAGGGGGGSSMMGYFVPGATVNTIVPIGVAGGGGGGGGASANFFGGDARLEAGTPSVANSYLILSINSISNSSLSSKGFDGATAVGVVGGGGGGGGGNGGSGGLAGEDYVVGGTGGGSGFVCQGGDNSLVWDYFNRLLPTADNGPVSDIRIISNVDARTGNIVGHGGLGSSNIFRVSDDGFEGAVAVYWTTANAAPTDWSLVPEFPNHWAVSLTNQTVLATVNNALTGIDFFPNGRFEYGTRRDLSPQVGRTISSWITKINSSIGALYEIRATLISGNDLSITATQDPKFGTWLPLGTRRSWYLTAGTVPAQIQIEIRRSSAPATVYSATYTVNSAGFGSSGGSGGSSGGDPSESPYVPRPFQ